MTTDFLETSIRYQYAFRVGQVLPEFVDVAPRPGSAPTPAASSQPATQKGGQQFAANQKEVQELCKRRFFYRQAFDIYGGVAGFYTYGPPGSALKNNLIKQWRHHFVIEENLMEVEDTCIMMHAVLKASGHVDRFNDFMVKDVVDESKFYRADKLLEEIMEEKLAAAGLTEAQRVEYTSVKNQADSYSRQEIGAIFQKYKIKSPETGNDLSDPYEFNLMFPTPIGPGGYLQGYLRPETAQGIFLNYKFCCEQNGNRLPFGVAQIGRAFRNEIAPRAGLTRQREFTQAEIEFFINPQKKEHPKFKEVEGTMLTLFHSNEQLAAKEPVRMSVGEAVRAGLVNNEYLGYIIVRTYMFLVSVGIDKEHVRFRQHLPTEMAHYATDCWDAEIYMSYGWMECVGIADRSAFDLNAHAAAAKCDLMYKELLETPIEAEVLSLTKPSGITVMKFFKKDGKMVKDWIEALPQASLEELAALKGPKEVEVGGKKFELTPDLLKFERKKEKISVNAFTPGVIEPSFGIDRIFTSILEHVYYTRPKEEDSGDKNERGVLAFPSVIAPYKCTILPLDQRISRHEKYAEMNSTFRAELSSFGLSFTMDESGATIGRRYSRNDELGIPFAVTFDFTTLEDKTVTMRERDSMQQIRLPLKDVSELVRDMCSGEKTWAAAFNTYGAA